MASMRNWVQRVDDIGHSDADIKDKKVAVVHCKAGKGRSGTVACSYLISEEGWQREEALQRFTSRRMRAGFGEGVSIPSQLRWVRYVDRWTNSMNKQYVERPVEIVEVHVEGLRDGVKVAIEGFAEEGRRIKKFHIFTRQEKKVMDANQMPVQQPSTDNQGPLRNDEVLSNPTVATPTSSTTNFDESSAPLETVVLKPEVPVILPTSDINIDFERRNKAGYTGFTMVTAIAHVWFNAYFEGGYEGHDSGVFEIEWEAMDGIKGSIRKGTKALDRLKVVWKYASEPDDRKMSRIITEPEKGEPVEEPKAADWRGEDADETLKAETEHSGGVSSGRPGGSALTMATMVHAGASSLGKELGLRRDMPESADISRASSVREANPVHGKSPEVESAVGEEEEHGVKSHGPGGEQYVGYDGTHDSHAQDEGVEGRQDTKVGHNFEAGLGKAAHIIAKMKGDGKAS